MTDINNVVLAGRLTRDVDLRHTGDGMAIAKIGMVVNDRRKSGNDWIDVPTYVDVTMFGKRAEAFERFHSKGSDCCFDSAKLSFDSWDDKATGAKRSKLYVIANSWEFIGGKTESKDPVPAGGEPF